MRLQTILLFFVVAIICLTHGGEVRYCPRSEGGDCSKPEQTVAAVATLAEDEEVAMSFTEESATVLHAPRSEEKDDDKEEKQPLVVPGNIIIRGLDNSVTCITNCQWFGDGAATKNSQQFCATCGKPWIHYKGPNNTCYPLPVSINNGSIAPEIVNSVKGGCDAKFIGGCKCKPGKIVNVQDIVILLDALYRDMKAAISTSKHHADDQKSAFNARAAEFVATAERARTVINDELEKRRAEFTPNPKLTILKQERERAKFMSDLDKKKRDANTAVDTCIARIKNRHAYFENKVETVLTSITKSAKQFAKEMEGDILKDPVLAVKRATAILQNIERKKTSLIKSIKKRLASLDRSEQSIEQSENSDIPPRCDPRKLPAKFLGKNFKFE